MPKDEQRGFLEGKLTEEEITEVLKRQASGVPVQASPVKQVEGNAGRVKERLESTNNHFASAINIASLAVLTSMGVNYFLDKGRQRGDTALREEMKDRVTANVRE